MYNIDLTPAVGPPILFKKNTNLATPSSFKQDLPHKNKMPFRTLKPEHGLEFHDSDSCVK